MASALLVVFPALIVLGALRDVTSYTIPNWISGFLILAFFPAALALELPLTAIGLHIGIFAAALAVGVGMFALNWIGGGDAKLFAAAALWFGWPAVFPFLIYTAYAGGAFTLVLLSLRSPLLRPYVLSGPRWFERLASQGEPIPYGVAIAAGALLAFPQSALMQNAGF